MRFRHHPIFALLLFVTAAFSTLLAPPRPAHAASTMNISGGVSTYTAGTYINNNLTITFNSGANTFTFQESGETISLGAGATGAGCTGSGTYTVVCPGGAITSFAVYLQDQNDTFTLAGSTTVPVSAWGGSGNDTMTGSDGVDTLRGEDGNDTITGGKGNDIMVGGNGDDRLIWNNGDNSDSMDGDVGNDTVEVNGAPAAGDIFTVAPSGSRVRFDRTNLVPFTLDILVEALLVNGLGGDDSATGAVGLAPLITMTFNGGDGTDTLTGGDGIDHLNGDAGNDVVVGGKGDDLMTGGEGDDRLVWNNGDNSDTMDGNAGSDTIEVNGAPAGDVFTVVANGARTKFDRTNLIPFTLDIDAEALVVNGLDGDDSATGAVGLAPLIALTFNGGNGNDALTGGDGIDHLNGDAGNDVVVGGKGDDLMTGGEGDDRLIWNNGDNSDTMDGDAGSDTVEVNGAPVGDIFTVVANGARVQFDRTNLIPFTLDIDAEALVVNGLDGDDSATGAVGLAPLIAMTFNGGNGNDALTGGDGADHLNGDAGNDTIVGVKGDDIMKGGEGDDRLIWNNGDNSDTMDGDGGNDVVEVNGAPAAGDIFTIAQNGARVRFDRTNLIPFTLDILAEAMEVNGLGADDQMSVTPLASTVLTLDGGDHSAGDTLSVNPQGATATNQGGTITIGGFAPVHHSNFETVTIASGGLRKLYLPMTQVRSGH